MSLTTERTAALSAARAIVDRAKSADRELTSAEQDQVEAGIAHVKELDAKIASGSIVKQVMGLIGPPAPESPGSLFDDHTKAGFLEAIKSKTAFRTTVDRAGMQTKAGPILEGTLVPPAGQSVSPALYPYGVTALADLMTTVPVSTPTVRYYRISSGTAAVVAEGAPKPDSGIGATAVDVTLAKIAALLKISDEASEDAPWLLGSLSAALVGAVVSKENEEVLASIGGASGILTKSGAAVDVIDLVAQAIAGMQAVGTNPSAVLVNPTTLATIRQAKATTSGTYVVDPLAAGPSTLHGVPLYAVNVVGPTTAYVIDGAGLSFFRRSTVTFELGHDADDWSHNMQTGRAETRGKCGVIQPLAVTKIALS